MMILRTSHLVFVSVAAITASTAVTAQQSTSPCVKNALSMTCSTEANTPWPEIACCIATGSTGTPFYGCCESSFTDGTALTIDGVAVSCGLGLSGSNGLCTDREPVPGVTGGIATEEGAKTPTVPAGLAVCTRKGEGACPSTAANTGQCTNTGQTAPFDVCCECGASGTYVGGDNCTPGVTSSDGTVSKGVNPNAFTGCAASASKSNDEEATPTEMDVGGEAKEVSASGDANDLNASTADSGATTNTMMRASSIIAAAASIGVSGIIAVL